MSHDFLVDALFAFASLLIAFGYWVVIGHVLRKRLSLETSWMNHGFSLAYAAITIALFAQINEIGWHHAIALGAGIYFGTEFYRAFILKRQFVS